MTLSRILVLNAILSHLFVLFVPVTAVTVNEVALLSTFFAKCDEIALFQLKFGVKVKWLHVVNFEI